MSLFQKKKKAAGPVQDVLLRAKKDRRALSMVPDPTGVRVRLDRRGGAEAAGAEAADVTEKKERIVESGARYEARFPVQATCYFDTGARRTFHAESRDISSTGLLLSVPEARDASALREAKRIRLRFAVVPGSMPEGFEMQVRMDATLAREQTAADGTLLCGLCFKETLAEYAARGKDRAMRVMSASALIFIVLVVLLMRAESLIYFQFNKVLYTYSIVAAMFLLSRYLFGAMYRTVPVNPDFTPGVTIIIPCFNEEEWIERTILGCINQDYPPERLEVIVVDDCSSDHSVRKVKETIARICAEGGRFDVENRLHYVVQEKNMGKREAMARGTKLARHELVVFVDSDSFLDPFAIRNLVQPFQDPKMGGVAGRTDVANTYTNSLTKMQAVRYYIAFRIMKAAEARFDAVTCLSGPLSCYKRELVIAHIDDWLEQRFLGQKATFGDDRAMTNFILRDHRTSYQDTAVCSTIVPNETNAFLKQQMRWKRSWLRESMLAGGFMWRKEPFMSLFFYIGILVPIAAPIVVVYNLVYVPIVHGVFPLTFILGLLSMALLMSFAQMLLRKSSTWFFGIVFCLYYEAVLLWQMPVAWFTFWKSTWGTRMTDADVQAKEKRSALRAQREAQRREREMLDE